MSGQHVRRLWPLRTLPPHPPTREAGSWGAVGQAAWRRPISSRWSCRNSWQRREWLVKEQSNQLLGKQQWECEVWRREKWQKSIILFCWKLQQGVHASTVLWEVVSKGGKGKAGFPVLQWHPRHHFTPAQKLWLGLFGRNLSCERHRVCLPGAGLRAAPTPHPSLPFYAQPGAGS